MILHKGCPRCGGDIMVDADIHGTFVKCIQCSRTKHIARVSPVEDISYRRYPRLPDQSNGSVAV